MRRIIPVLFFVFLIAEISAQTNLFEHFTTVDGLSSNKVYDAVQGQNGNVWFATEKGVCSFNGLSFDCKKVNGQPVIGLLTDPNGSTWCYDANAKFYKYNGNQFSSLPLNSIVSDKLSTKIINSVYVDRLTNIYIGSVLPNTLQIISNENKVSTYEEASKINTKYYAIQVTTNGFVCGTNSNSTGGNSLKLITQKGELTVSLSNENSATKSRFIQLQNGTYLYANNIELIHLSDKKVLARTFLEKSIETIFEDNGGRIWVGLYQGGAVSFPDGNINSTSKINYLGKATVSKIIEDNSGSLWFATLNDGVYLLDAMATLNYTAPDVFSKTNTEKVENITQSVISEQQIEQPTANKLKVLTTDSTYYDSIPPKIYISGIRMNDEFLPMKSMYEFKHDENFIKINFAGFSYAGAGQLQYKYRLEGLEDKWNYTNTTNIQYTTLPPGKYRFVVSVMNKVGIWSDSAAGFEFTIATPWWNTWWFYSLSGSILILILLFLVRNVKKREQRKTEIAKQMAQLELQGLRAQMNPHFLFNTLSSIQHYITENDNKATLKYLSKFAKLMRKIIDNSRDKVITVKDEVEALELYLELEKLRFREKFDYEVTVDASVEKNYDEIPAMLIQPYVENAILHGISNKTEKGNIWISIKRENDLLVCTVTDDGIGRQAAAEIKNKKTSTHKSQGMSITRERLQVLNKMNDSNLSVNVVDLNDEAGRPTGTKVEIYVPLNNE